MVQQVFVSGTTINLQYCRSCGSLQISPEGVYIYVSVITQALNHVFLIGIGT
jgi:hypothetical protein